VRVAAAGYNRDWFAGNCHVLIVQGSTII